MPILERLSPNAWVEMNPRDARALRLEAAGPVDVVSRRGRVRGVELRVTETIAPGQVFVPFHYAEANANQVTQSAFDPISREPNYKQSAVRVETRRARRRTMKRLVVVGNGMAGMACVEQILKYAPQFRRHGLRRRDARQLQPHLLSSVLAGEKAADDIVINALEWYRADEHRPARRRPHRRRRSRARRPSPATTAASRRTTRCCSRPAARAWMPPIDGLDKDGVFAFRTLDDTRELLRRVGPGDRRRSSSAAACSASKPRAACRCRAATSPSCT